MTEDDDIRQVVDTLNKHLDLYADVVAKFTELYTIKIASDGEEKKNAD